RSTAKSKPKSTSFKNSFLRTSSKSLNTEQSRRAAYLITGYGRGERTERRKQPKKHPFKEFRKIAKSSASAGRYGTSPRWSLAKSTLGWNPTPELGSGTLAESCPARPHRRGSFPRDAHQLHNLVPDQATPGSGSPRRQGSHPPSRYFHA